MEQLLEKYHKIDWFYTQIEDINYIIIYLEAMKLSNRYKESPHLWKKNIFWRIKHNIEPKFLATSEFKLSKKQAFHQKQERALFSSLFSKQSLVFQLLRTTFKQ
jgi:hypothetical protein